jgi:four helix bundle protein
MRNFKDLRIWQKGIDIAVKTFKLTDTFPKEDKFGLSQQMNRAGVSIPSNIAEGSSRTSQKDYTRFIEISLGSAFELETQIVIAERLNKGNQELLQELKADVTDQQRMLTGFQQKLSS